MSGELAPSITFAPTESAAKAIKRVRYWHEYVIDLMLTNPEMTQNQIAEMLGRTPAWLSRVVNSEMFQLAKAERRAGHNAAIEESVLGKLESLADLSIDLMTERVLQHGNELPMSTLRETSEMALKALGYTATPKGMGGGGGVAVQVNVHQVGPESLEEARRLLRAANEPKPGDLDNDRFDSLPSPERISASQFSVYTEVRAVPAALDSYENAEPEQARGAEI